MDGSQTETRVATTGTNRVGLEISGMTCSGCAGRVERALQSLESVKHVSVNLASEKAQVEIDSDITLDPALLVAAVADAGYEASLSVDEAGFSKIQLAGDRRQLILLVCSVVLTAPFMVQMIFMPTDIHFVIPAVIQLTLGSLVQFIPGSRFYGPAWRALKAGTANMDTLVVLGTTATWGLSTYLIWAHGLDLDPHSLYFEASASVITLVLVGKYMETKARRSTASAIRSLAALRPDTVRIRVNDTDQEIALTQLKVGNIIVIKPGERIAADARVIEGASHVDEALLTGESLPVDKKVGDGLIGGAINGEGLLLAATTAIGSDSKLSQIIKLVETAQVDKPPVQKLVDRIASYFVPFIILVAIATLVGWVLSGASVDQALIHAATVLVIACPCALGLATPTAIMVGTGAAAKAGILIRDMEILEQANSIDCVVFDKTGTLTEGKPKVVGIEVVEGDETALIRRVAAAQQGSEHPLAKAIIAHALSLGQILPSVQKFRSYPGRGISASVEGQSLVIGSLRWMKSSDIDVSRPPVAITDLAESGNSVVWVGDVKSRKVLAVLAIGDAVRSTALAAVAELKTQGIEVVLLSGDNLVVAERIASELGIGRVIADVLPDEKAAVIDDLKSEGFHVAMVGDGVNDAPALAHAHMGMAMGSGTDVAMETAGVTLMRSDPSLAIGAIDISRTTYRKIRHNLFWAFIYNFVAIPLAVFGVLSPVIAGAAMAMSSVSVVASSLLLRRWRLKGNG